MHGHQHRFGGHGSTSEPFGRFAANPSFGPMSFLQGMGQVAQRARRGDVRQAVLRLLSEQPMHGYQIIGELSERSGGVWNPSAGSIYPTLQLLADEGLVAAEDVGGKRVFRLTEAGTAAVAESAGQPAPWEEASQQRPGAVGYREALAKLMRAVFQVGKGGSPEQVKAGIEVLNDARRRLYAILAED
jgi:DNA-binding PadR family transcriptional regulator